MRMSDIEGILALKVKPKEKQALLVEAVVSGTVPVKEFIAFFESAKNTDKGSCADAMKHISAQKPALLAPYIELLSKYINHPLPRVKWGVQEAIGKLAKDYPEKAAKAIPNLLKNTTEEKENTTVVKWCAAYALAEIAKHNPKVRKQLLPLFDAILAAEKNNGVKNVYLKAIKAMGRGK